MATVFRGSVAEAPEELGDATGIFSIVESRGDQEPSTVPDNDPSPRCEEDESEVVRAVLLIEDKGRIRCNLPEILSSLDRVRFEVRGLVVKGVVSSVSHLAFNRQLDVRPVGTISLFGFSVRAVHPEVDPLLGTVCLVVFIRSGGGGIAFCEPRCAIQNGSLSAQQSQRSAQGTSDSLRTMGEYTPDSGLVIGTDLKSRASEKVLGEGSSFPKGSGRNFSRRVS